jgi:hypothetical protein
MRIIFQKEEAEDIFLDALVNGLDYIQGYGLLIELNNNYYEQAKESLNNPCYEDILLQILRDGNTLTIIDYEGDDEWSITLEDVHERMSNVPFDDLVAMTQGTDDASTADVILQTIFLNEVVFG